MFLPTSKFHTSPRTPLRQGRASLALGMALAGLTLALAACAPQAPLGERVPLITSDQASNCTELGEVMGYHHNKDFARSDARWKVLAAGGNALRFIRSENRTGRNGSEILVYVQAYRCEA